MNEIWIEQDPCGRQNGGKCLLPLSMRALAHFAGVSQHLNCLVNTRLLLRKIVDSSLRVESEDGIKNRIRAKGTGEEALWTYCLDLLQAFQITIQKPGRISEEKTFLRDYLKRNCPNFSRKNEVIESFIEAAETWSNWRKEEPSDLYFAASALTDTATFLDRRFERRIHTALEIGKSVLNDSPSYETNLHNIVTKYQEYNRRIPPRR